MSKSKKSKAEKRMVRLRRDYELRTPLYDDNGNLCPDSWEQRATEAFGIYMTHIILDLLGGPDKNDPDPIATRDKTYGLGRLAWNLLSDSDSLAEAKARLANDDHLPVPAQALAGVAELLEAMMELREELYPDMDAYIDELEFTKLPSGKWDLAITVSRREG